MNVHFCAVSVLALLFCPVSSSHSDLLDPIEVSEAKVAFHLFPEPRVEVPVFNHTNQVIGTTVVVEMLSDSSNRVIAHHDTTFQVAPGRHTVTLDWDLSELPTKSVRMLSAYRLRYLLTPIRNPELQAIQGILQMGRHMVDGFGVQGYPSGQFPCALDCRFLVRVAEPNSGSALVGYDVRAEFGGDHGIVMRAVSDADGYALLRYQIPSDCSQLAVTMSITVSRGPFSEGWTGQLLWAVPPHLTLITDKPAYHRGEAVRIQVVLTDVHSRRWAGGNVSLTITDGGDSHEIEKKKLVTSLAGEAVTTWTIPADSTSKRLSILAVSDDEPQANWTAKKKVRIVVVPQEHPKFVLSTVPDRAYYLPGQIANLDIRAAEFAGGPVVRGKVFVKGIWDVSFSGELNDAGKLKVTVDPKKMWDWISQAYAPGWPQPRSWDFPVEVTVADASNERTETSHVVLQLAPQDVHLTVDDRPRLGSEKTLGIVTSYVDRSPVPTYGVAEATMPDDNGNCPAAKDARHRIVLGNFHTNRYGVARLALPAGWIEYAYPKSEDGAYSWYARVRKLDAPNEQATRWTCILVQAKDSKGKTGSLIEHIAVVPGTRFATRISTDHTLYRPGDPLRVRIESDEGLKEVAVEIRTPSWELVASQHLLLKNGEADTRFPYSARFRGLLTVQVYAVTTTEDPNTADSWSTDVIYPTGERMKVSEPWGDEIRTPDEFQPGNQNIPDNPNIVVADAETEGGRRIAGLGKEDLLEIDPVKPIPGGMDLVAWELLGPPKSWGGWSWGYYNFRYEEFDKENLAALERALQKIPAQKEARPATEEDLVKELREAGIEFQSLRDGWGRPYRLVLSPGQICLVSDGPDKAPNTKDDYVALRFPRF